MFYRLRSIAQCGRKLVIQDFDLCKDTALVEVFLTLHYLFRIETTEAFLLLPDDHITQIIRQFSILYSFLKKIVLPLSTYSKGQYSFKVH